MKKVTAGWLRKSPASSLKEKRLHFHFAFSCFFGSALRQYFEPKFEKFGVKTLERSILPKAGKRGKKWRQMSRTLGGRGSQSWILAPAASSVAPENLLTRIFLALGPDLLNHKLWGGAQRPVFLDDSEAGSLRRPQCWEIEAMLEQIGGRRHSASIWGTVTLIALQFSLPVLFTQ